MVKRITNALPREIAWCLTLIVVLTFGIYAGHKVTAAYRDAELAAMRAQMERANEETAFWRATLKMIVDGGQVDGISLSGRPSKGD